MSAGPCTLGDRGHAGPRRDRATARTVEDDVLIAMRAVVMNGGADRHRQHRRCRSVGHEGTRDPAAQHCPGHGPACVVRPASPAMRKRIRYAVQHYVAAARRYRGEAWTDERGGRPWACPRGSTASALLIKTSDPVALARRASESAAEVRAGEAGFWPLLWRAACQAPSLARRASVIP